MLLILQIIDTNLDPVFAISEGKVLGRVLWQKSKFKYGISTHKLKLLHCFITAMFQSHFWIFKYVFYPSLDLLLKKTTEDEQQHYQTNQKESHQLQDGN